MDLLPVDWKNLSATTPDSFEFHSSYVDAILTYMSEERGPRQ